jgi:hypothetical protein
MRVVLSHDILNVVDGQIIRLCKQRACALELKAGGQQLLAPPVLLSLGLGLQNRRAGTQLFPDGDAPPARRQPREREQGLAGFLQLSAAGRCLSRDLRMKALRRTVSFKWHPLGQHGPTAYWPRSCEPQIATGVRIEENRTSCLGRWLRPQCAEPRPRDDSNPELPGL